MLNRDELAQDILLTVLTQPDLRSGSPVKFAVREADALIAELERTDHVAINQEVQECKEVELCVAALPYHHRKYAEQCWVLGLAPIDIDEPATPELHNKIRRALIAHAKRLGLNAALAFLGGEEVEVEE